MENLKMKKDIIDICRDVINRAGVYSELIAEVDDEISVRFSWVIDALDEIKADLFNVIHGAHRLAGQIDEFVLLRQSAEIVIANSPADAYFSHDGKQISMEKAQEIIKPESWEKEWSNRNIAAKLWILE